MQVIRDSMSKNVYFVDESGKLQCETEKVFNIRMELKKHYYYFKVGSVSYEIPFDNPRFGISNIEAHITDERKRREHVNNYIDARAELVRSML